MCMVSEQNVFDINLATKTARYRILLHPFFAAVEVILNNVIRYPASSQATSDLHFVEPFLRLLEILAGDKRQCSRSEEAEKMYRLSNELNGRTREAVERSDMSFALEFVSTLEQ